jgi:hypothetical protein
MYSTCLFCHARLGSNDAIEHFPVGRRLAFDAQRGRLWVVCRRCERWNLTPVEERWEAIEECERLFRDTRLRVSTDNIGLARIREGLELVRIGAPQRPELAAWRYGDQFGRRRRKHLIYTGAGFATAVGFVVLGPATGIIAGSSWGMWNLLSVGNSMYQQRRVRARIVLPGRDAPVSIRLRQLSRIAVVSADDGWALSIPFQLSAERVELANGRFLQGSRWNAGMEYTETVRGAEAIRLAARLLPAINASGARRDEVQSAVGMIEETPEPDALFARWAKPQPSTGRLPRTWVTPPASHEYASSLVNLPKEVRLALEMATHEESERRALEGELALLEAAWQQAEEIAAISDDMFVSDETREKLATLRRTGRTER